MSVLTLSLISHTNVGKTTLARTLLRRDVGDAGDRPHVTDTSESYELVAAGDDVLRLWDTPGFGDTAKLVKRLRASDKPFAWLRTQVWDRLADRPLWCSQQAVKNVREEADVVLYLVNAAEDPGAAGYVDLEMEVQSWIGVPVLVLLNQTGEPKGAGAPDPEAAAWRRHLDGQEVVREVLGLDAFSRCWVQERELFRAVSRVVPDELGGLAARLASAWDEENERVFGASVEVLGETLAASAADRVEVSEETLLQKFWIGRGKLNREMRTTRKAMAERLAGRVRSSTNRLIALHGLEGESARRMEALSRDSFSEPERVHESLWSAMGGAAAGAGGGLAADLAHGGLTFGGGMVLGGIGGGAASYLLAKGLNLVRGKDNSVGWTGAHFLEQVKFAVLGYLAVAHFGRGRGVFEDGEVPEHWADAAGQAVAGRESELTAIAAAGRAGEEAADLCGPATAELGAVLKDALERLYPD